MQQMPAISGIDDPSQARVVLYQGGREVNAPLNNVGLQPLDSDLTAIAALTTTAYGRSLLTSASAAALVTSLGLREVLTANRTYYVRTDGSDSNNGLANTSGGAFLTIQKACDVALGLDFGGYTVTVQVADGTYTGATTIGRGVGLTATDSLVIQGNSSTPANVIISVTSNNCFLSNVPGAMCLIKDMELRTITSGVGLRADAGAVITFSNIRFGACPGSHIIPYVGGVVRAVGNYSIVGAAAAHLLAAGGIGDVTGRTVTITGTPAITNFMSADRNGLIECSGMTFVGATTGNRYNAARGGGIFTNGGGASYLPGSVAGTATSPGWYA